MDVNESLERAAALHEETDEAARTAEQLEERESFDAFWSEVKAKEKPRYETILGIAVRVPTSMTLRFRQRLDHVDMAATSEDDVREILGDLFGVDTIDRWISAGMDEEQLAVVMAWAMACANGRTVTWRDAYEAVQEGKAKRAAKAKALAAKSPTSTSASAGTGGRSKGGRSRKGSKRKR
ncbi:hypothetical protein [Nocardiopsis tropica]|uniref:Tail assembly chaperone n=1 Tax=Nocardiopsis tropica TaxID=109330 RepID=A0ABU7KLY9_9ACTN|nr:hypothetical protein [Nocardiopsis umidischolae]MEE2050304.1 hypothetical protein [Nocardiopsis umidischolae]